MLFRPLIRDDVGITITAEPEWTPVCGNAMASGDDTLDKEVEDDILGRLEQGEVWAWTAVTVTVSWQGQQASDHLGCCSYRDEDDFRQPDGYFDDMVDEAVETLNVELSELYAQLSAREA